MWDSICKFVLANPSVAIFLTLAIGYWVGRFQIKSFKLGATVGVLLVGLIIGQIGKFNISEAVKNIFFDLFIFTIGYEVGPAFIESFKKKGIKFIIQSVVFSVVALGLFKIFHIQFGEAGGIIAGSLTQSACIGTANSAIQALHISNAAKQAAISQVAIAYALTYVFGTVGVLIFLKNIAPAILHKNLKEETKKYIEENHIEANNGGVKISSNIRVRAFVVNENSNLLGKTISDFSQVNPGLVIESVVRNNQQLLAGDTIIKANDTIVIVGHIHDFVKFVNATHDIAETDASSYALHLTREQILIITMN